MNDIGFISFGGKLHEYLKGGITEEGIKVLRVGLPDVFDQMFRSTLDKHEKGKAAIRDLFHTN